MKPHRVTCAALPHVFLSVMIAAALLVAVNPVVSASAPSPASSALLGSVPCPVNAVGPEQTNSPGSARADQFRSAAVPGGSGQSSGRQGVILGDSYQSGVGASDYPSGLGASDPCLDPKQIKTYDKDRCHQSSAGYAVTALQNAGYDPRNLACSRAQTDDVLAQIRGNKNVLSEANLVVLGIGGNDIGFGDILDACINDALECWDSYGAPKPTDLGLPLQTSIEILVGDLTELLIEIANVTPPDAPIILVGYPHIIPAGGLLTISPDEATWMRLIHDKLTEAQKRAVETVRNSHNRDLRFVAMELPADLM
jgi:GDSL-like Lipase/Acylhydrolase family